MSFIYSSYSERDNPYPARYVYLAAGVLPALGASFIPDGVAVVDNDTVLFTGLTAAADRGIFRATVVAGNVTAWTRIIYGQSSIGACTDGDIVVILEGTTYSDHQFQCTDTAAATWVDLGLVANLWTRTGSKLSPKTVTDEVYCAAFSTNQVTKAAADTGYTVTASDHTVFVDTSAGDTTINLPTAVGCAGREYCFKKTSLLNTMTIGGGGVLIDGEASINYLDSLSAVVVQSDNSTWWVVN
ncbi:hypothetical protein GW915_11915 [bacterium]|nr:hypothetical protein [bacterium]